MKTKTDETIVEFLCECDNCGKQWGESKLKEVKRLFERVDAGVTMPAGECPECGALAYPVTTDKAREASEIKRLKAERDELLAACELAAKLIPTARQYFPKSIKNSDRFDLENTCATIGSAIYNAKAKGAK